MLHAVIMFRATWAFSLFTSPLIAMAALTALMLSGCQCEQSFTEEPDEATGQVEPTPNGSKRQPEPPAWSDAWLIARGAQYLDDRAHRRRSMVTSLRNPKNLYARQRIASYGHGTRGWDALPVWNPRSEIVHVTQAHGKRSMAPSTPTSKVWNGHTPKTADAWRALGKEVFHRYPLRADAFVAFGIAADQRMKQFGIERDAAGQVPGVVRFVDVDGKTKVGITCALCHTSVQSGNAVDGLARRAFDYGALRLAMHEQTGTPVDPELARRMAIWGPGRADITEDEAEDPVTIPDLWDLRHYESLTQAGTIRHVGPVALALRQETQLLHANHQRTRPPRELAWALAMYIYALRPPPRASDWPAPDAEQVSAGKKLFDEHCARCHSNPAGGGPVVDAPKLGTDQALAFGVARGTGKYRPPNLTRVSDAAPYFHTGTLPTLEALFDPRRLQESYVQTRGNVGAVTGHAFGLDWPDADKTAMLAYLRSL